jgi:hypothetical protein
MGKMFYNTHICYSETFMNQALNKQEPGLQCVQTCVDIKPPVAIKAMIMW